MSENLLPPSRHEAECAVLGACLRYGSFHEAAAVIAPSDFYTYAHVLIFGAMVQIGLSGNRIDPVSVSDYLHARDQIKDVKYEYLVELWDSSFGGSRVVEWALQVKETSIQRDLQRACFTILREIDSPSMAGAEILDFAERTVFEVGKRRMNHLETLTMAKVINDTSDRVELRHQAVSDGKRGATGISSGLLDLDTLTGGFHNGEVTIIAARPSVGKTAFGLNLFYAAVNQQQACLFFSLEQGYLEIGERFLCMESLIDSHRIRGGFLNPDEMERIAKARDKFQGVGSWINDKPGITIMQILAEARRIKARNGLAMLILDYLQLVEPDNPRDQRHLQVGAVSRGLKLMAKDLNIPVIAMAQLSRAGEERRPRLSDLRESGSIEQDADNVIFLHDPNRHEQGPREGALDVLVAKQRNGPVGEFQVMFIRKNSRFWNAAK